MFLSSALSGFMMRGDPCKPAVSYFEVVSVALTEKQPRHHFDTGIKLTNAVLPVKRVEVIADLVFSDGWWILVRNLQELSIDDLWKPAVGGDRRATAVSTWRDRR